MENDDLVPASRDRMRKYQDQHLLPMSLLRENSSIDPLAQIRIAQHLIEAPVRWSSVLNWSGFPTSAQLTVVRPLNLYGDSSGPLIHYQSVSWSETRHSCGVTLFLWRPR